MELPEPLTPADCDLRGLEYMPFHGSRLFSSDFYARANDSEFRAAMSLWWACWQQVPAASLPDDDVILCRLADLGRDLKTWKRVKANAMHGFTLCNDGRFYHGFLSEAAAIAWDKRVKERERKAEWRAKRTVTELPQVADVPRDRTRTAHGRDADVPADGNRRDGTILEEEPSGSSPPKPPKSKRAVRCPDGWEPGPLPADLAAEVARQPEGWEARELSLMRDWSRSSPNGAKLDWDAAWRNWLKKGLEDGKRGMAGHSGANGTGPYKRDPAWEGLKRLHAELGPGGFEAFEGH